MANEMTGREIVNLIDDLRSKGLSDTSIIETIKFIELNDPKANYQQSAADTKNDN